MGFLFSLYFQYQYTRAKTRAMMFGLHYKNFKNQVLVMPRCSFENVRNTTFGKYIFINRECIFSTPDGITIGNYVMIGSRCIFASVTHGFSDWKTPMIFQKVTVKPIVIEDDVWIGANVTVQGGVRIGRGSIVAAGAVVSKDVPPFSIVGGIPAKVMKDRFDVETIKKAAEVRFTDPKDTNLLNLW